MRKSSTNSIGASEFYLAPSSRNLSGSLNSSRVQIHSVKSADWRYDRKLRKANHEHWSPSRLAIAHVILNERFDRIIAIMALIQLALVVYETDLETNDDQVPVWVHMITNIFLAFYTLELACSVFVWQSSFLQHKMNICDLLLICIDIFTTLLSEFIGNLPSVSVLRVIRVVRVLRMGHVLMQFRELYFMVHGLVYALKAVAWACVIIGLLLTLWSIMAVKVLHPIMAELVDDGTLENCSRCRHAFKTVRQSNLTFFQTVVAGDSWGSIAVPVIEHYPWTAIIFCGVVLSVQLGVMNLILTVIVDSAMEARENDLQHRLLDKAVAYDRSVKELSGLCKDLDEDKDGFLTKEELFDGYETNMDFRDLLDAMDADKDDIDVIYEVLDADHSGNISYNEFVNQLHKMKTQDVQTLLVFIKCHLGHIRRDVESQLHLMMDELLDIVRSDHRMLTVDHQLLTNHWGEGVDASDRNTASAAHTTTLPAEGQRDPPCPQYESTPSTSEFKLQPIAECVQGTSYPSESNFQPMAECAQARLNECHQNFDGRLESVLQDALKKVEDQTVALRSNCRLITSLNKSLAKALSLDQGSLPGASQRCQKPDSTLGSSPPHATAGHQDHEHLIRGDDDSLIEI